MQKCASGNTCEVDLPAWNVSSVSFSTDADWPADFFFLICDFYYEQFGFGGEISEIM